MQPGYTILEHPADIGIEARGDTLQQVFEQAAKGMMSVILDPGSVDSVESHRLDLRADDVEQLLVRWLAEILYYFDGRRFLAKEFVIDRMTATRLEAVIRGESHLPHKHRMNMDVKAVTYHQLCVRNDTQGWYARVFLDI